MRIQVSASVSEELWEAVDELYISSSDAEKVRMAMNDAVAFRRLVASLEPEPREAGQP